jgi:hypothetical protein
MGNFAVVWILAGQARRTIEGILKAAWWMEPRGTDLSRLRDSPGLSDMPPTLTRFEVALFACFGVSIDVFPGFSYSYSALAVLVLVLVLEDTASSTIKVKTSQFQNLRVGYKDLSEFLDGRAN